MTAEEVRKIVIEIIEEIAPDEDYENLVDSEPLRDQLGLDSMDFLDIVNGIEKTI